MSALEVGLKKKAVLDAVERYAEAREEAVKARGALLLQIDQAFKPEEQPATAVESGPRKRNYIGPKTQPPPRGGPTGMERVLSAFRDAGVGVELDIERVTKAAGLSGSTAFAYLSKLARDGLLARPRPGVYTLTEKGKAERT